MDQKTVPLTTAKNSMEDFVRDYHQLILDAQNIFDETTGLTGDKAQDARLRGTALLQAALAKLQTSQQYVVESSKQMAACTNRYVISNPWSSVGIAAGTAMVMGVLTGYLLARK